MSLYAFVKRNIILRDAAGKYKSFGLSLIYWYDIITEQTRIFMMNETEIAPTLLYSVLCDDIRREDNGKFILIGLFETIGTASFPTSHPTLYVINCWCSGMGVFRQRTRIVAPDNNKLIEDADTEFNLSELKSKHRIVARFNNIHFQIPGEYAVEVLLNNELKVRYPLLVEQVSPKKND